MSIEQKIPNTSELISDEMKKQMTPLFSKMNRRVTLKAILNPEEEKSVEMGAFLKAIAACSDLLAVEFYERDENAELDRELRSEYLPVVGIYGDTYTGACFHGTPGGKEINSFIAAICTFGGAASPMDKRLFKNISAIKKQTDIKVFVSLACHHCPHVVAASQKIALASEYVTAEMYDAKLYPDLVEKYKIERVPMTVINDSIVVMGQKTIEEMVNKIRNI